MTCKRCGKPIAPGTGYIRVNGRPAHLVCPSPETPRRRPSTARRPKAR